MSEPVRILYQDGIEIGEVSEWTQTDRPAEVRNVLGKEILMKKPDDECKFVSPKPVGRRNKLTMIIDGKTEIRIQQTWIQGTHVTGNIVETRELGRKE